jgi:hypothetical protein
MANVLDVVLETTKALSPALAKKVVPTETKSQAETETKQAKAAQVQAEAETGPSVPTETEPAALEEKATEQIASEKIKTPVLGRRRRRHPSLDAFARLAAPTKTRRLADLTLHPTRRRTKAHDKVVSSRGLVQHGGPRVNRPIVTGPARPLRITGLICKGFPVITVCNPALWEYSGDNLGA